MKLSQPIVEMKNIHKWYGKVRALRGVSFEVYPGEILGLVGGNGAGKSTLVKILSGVISPNRGQIFFDGQEVNIKNVGEARKLGIETVHQHQAVIGDRTVYQNIFLGREPVKSLGPLQILDHEKMRKESTRITKKLGLDISSPEQEVRFCSGGERQGVAIARAMYFRAQLVILDEPTTALSPKGSKQVLNFASQLKDEGVAAIFVTHNLHEVYPISDRFVILERGEKIKDIAKNEITENELEDMLVT